MPYSAPRLDRKNVLTGSSFQLTIDELPNVYFSKMSELKRVKEQGEYYDGISNLKRYTDDGISSCEPVTLEIPYDPDTALIIADWIADHLEGFTTSLTVRPVRINKDGDIFPLSVAYYLVNCRASEFIPMSEIDRGSNDVIMSSLTFTLEAFSIR